MDNSNTQGSFPSILIVDDNPQNLQVLGKMLQENEFEIEFATNGNAALDWLNTSPFDLILLDINMPGMNGFEICTRVRANKKIADIPIIFLSADTERESILKGFELGAQDYVTKPFDSRELLARVRTQIALRDSLRKLEEMNTLLEDKVKKRTEQLQGANEKLKEMNNRLLELDEAKAGFLNLISHEIRTPLNGILGPLQLLKDSYYIQDLALPVEMLDNSIKRLERFSMDALLITKLKVKKFKKDPVEIQLDSLIMDINARLRHELPHKIFEIKITQNLDNRVIKGDKELISKCLYNILQNAILYSSWDCMVKVNLKEEIGQVVCEIIDNGEGFEKNILDKGFGLFAPGRKYLDSRVGLGLPMAEMITELHGGKMEISNYPEGGAVVRLSFKRTGK